MNPCSGRSTTDRKTPVLADVMTNFYRYYATRFCQIVERLAAIPEGEGSMLDNTLANELGSPNHDWGRYPMVLAGGGRHFRLGRYLHWPRTQMVKGTLGDDIIDPAHNRALVSLVRAFGVSADHVGEKSLPGAGGPDIDTTGALEGLT